MKKQLLLSTALLATISVFSQQPGSAVKSSAVNMVKENNAKIERLNKATEKIPEAPVKHTGAELPAMKSAASLSNTVWNPISASMNIYGVLLSSSKPLQYNNELNAVSFIHRKSPSYPASPYPTPLGAETGAIVGMVTTNWGTHWDSTCIWNNNNYWARYPQGGISNPVMNNTNIANAYLVATGPITQANTSSGWVGNFFASKPLSTYDATASATPGAQKFIPSADDTLGKVDFARIDFTATDDGVVRTLGGIWTNINGGAQADFRGVKVIKGTYNAGVFAWTSDSLPVIVTTDTQDGSKNWFGGRFNQAWSEDGTIGYAWYYGCRIGATGNNIGFQPIVFKSTNGGAWTAIPSIDFNDKVTFKKPVLDHLFPAFNDTARIIPFFNFRESFDGTVDANGQLHIMAALWSSSRSHPDSVGFAYTNFVNWDGETYSYAHGETDLAPYDATKRFNKPYIYDFYTRSNGTWNVALVDSMSSEAPGETSTDDGFGDNPWDIADNVKAGSDARFQMSRTPGGSKIIYTWTESDTGYTNQGRKWNHVNNLKARMMDINPSLYPAYKVNDAEYNLSNPASGIPNPYVKDRAQMHNTSPKCAVTGTSVVYPCMLQVSFSLPVKITNNQNTPMQQTTPNVHWYSSAAMDFTIVTCIVGMDEYSQRSLKSNLFPNPAAGNAQLQVELDESSKVEITIMNIVGQVINTASVNGQQGRNDIPLNVQGLPPGIYIVNVKAGNATGTNKLVIE